MGEDRPDEDPRVAKERAARAYGEARMGVDPGLIAGVERTDMPRLKGIQQHFDLDNIFSYHSPTPYQAQQYELIRAAAKTLAAVIEANTPSGADQADAIRKVREAVMTANAAIALRGQLYKY